jgi:hypothetical protein
MIDMITGVVIAHYMHIMSEKIAFYIDVLVFKIGSTNTKLADKGAGKLRQRKYLKPCYKCGWGNIYAGDYMSPDEKKWLKHVFKQSLAVISHKSCGEEEKTIVFNPS